MPQISPGPAVAVAVHSNAPAKRSQIWLLTQPGLCLKREILMQNDSLFGIGFHVLPVDTSLGIHEGVSGLIHDILAAWKVLEIVEIRTAVA